MKRARTMPDYYVRSVIVAELRRAKREGCFPDRHYLRNETGIPWHNLDRRIAGIRLELDQQDSAAPDASQQAAEGGAKAPDPSPTKGSDRPFAPPTGRRKRQC